MEISLINKKALVGGSTQGIGKAIALQLAASGASVTLMARNEEKLKKVLSELDTKQGQKHQYLVVDFLKLEMFQEKVAAFFKNNQIDILVNNTNGPEAGSVLEKDTEDYQTAFNLLFQTVCFTTLQALPHMQKSNFGRVINVSSVSVREPLAHLTLSNTIRTSVISWSKTLATEVAKNHITVNNILTGYFDTERLNSLINMQASAKKVEPAILKLQMELQVPAQRFGKPVEYGYLVTFLASDQAAYITGTNIPIDGGLLKSIG